MPNYFALFFALLLSSSAKASSADTSEHAIKAIEICDTSTFFGEKSTSYYNVGPFVIYKSQYSFDSSSQQLKFDSTTNKMDVVEESQFSEKRDRFFVFHRDSSYGFMYDPHRNNETPPRLLVDSIVKLIKGSNSFEHLIGKNPDSTTWNSNKTNLKEVYVQKAVSDTPTIRLIFYYTSNMNLIKESFNPMLDSAKGLKLYKYDIVVEEFYSEKDKRLWPQVTMTSEMRQIVADSREVMPYIEKYKKSIGLVKQ